MNLSKERFSAYVKNFEFKELFIDMGWNNDRVTQHVVVDSAIFVLESVAEKEGFKILNCSPVTTGLIPEYSLRKKIEHQVSKIFHEHLIIYTDTAKKEQIWQLAVRESGKPLKVTETSYKTNQSPDKLYQKAGGLFITIDEEEKITIVDVKSLVTQNFQQNSEKITKKFYDGFKKQHTVFIDFIKGIQAQGDREWYASLMLNRLMFCYFIQKKGFLDKNKNYLQDKLKACQRTQGQFYSFYRSFLLVLFHQGLGSPNHNAELVVDIGQVPYLNGGLFDEHEIEMLNKDINVDDKAFESLFKFFDEWDWHLDTSMNASGKEINPDVIGYIFEKYINDRAEMGAYYTKEDITEYISKNCIIPFLFDETKRAYPSAYSPDSLVWLAVKESGDAYIYEAVKYGVPPPDEQGNTPKLFDDLPDNIQMGFVPELEMKFVDGSGSYLFDLRKKWNTPAPSAIALPTEIYRDVIERRKRCADLRNKIAKGEITSINDFITCNLNIRQFTQDLIENIDDHEFIRHFYKALCKITILDPTCGSGAFLFAALNILEPLYEACLLRMRSFVEDEDRMNVAEQKTFGHKFKFFRETLACVQSEMHPNQAYFIYKSIILNNLYGVDIMNEAVEIAKLRLFLKMVSTVDIDYRKPNLGLEPLPDVDFNIRTGNTLIGYAQKNQIESITGLFVTDEHKKSILEQCDVVNRTYSRYKDKQLINDDYEDFKDAKNELNNRLISLTNSLDKILFEERYKGYGYELWIATHKPFHWFAEFYEIIEYNGGFDVIIGNPPYVKISKLPYALNKNEYISLPGKNLYSIIIERSFLLTSRKSYFGMITPVSICSGSGFLGLMNILFTKQSWVSSYSNRPGKLFEGVEQRLTIFISSQLPGQCMTSPYQHWYSEERNSLFDKLSYISAPRIGPIPLKSGCDLNKDIITKILASTTTIQSILGHDGECWYHDGPTYWIRCLPFFPSGNSSDNSMHYHCLKGLDEMASNFIVSILASSTFYLYYKASSNCRDFGIENILSFRINRIIPDTKLLIERYELQLKETSMLCKRLYPSGLIEYNEYYPSKSKTIIDEIDCLMAQHYGFTQNELDAIINYDIKYRMGKEL